MNRRILIIEPDATIRRMMEHALASAGFVPTSVATIELSRAVLDQKPIEAVIVELRASNAEGTEGVRALRNDYPELPMIVTGTLMTTRVMEELIRRRVDGVIAKPFTPRELVGAMERVLREASTRGAGGMEYAAAMNAARRAIIEGRPRDAESPLERARAASPLDAEAMALLALCLELEGNDEDADRGYRAALALQSERVTEDALPSEGLARLKAYEGARVVPSFDHKGKHVLWFVDAAAELSRGSPQGVSADVVVFALGLVPNEIGATYARLGKERAFLISTATMNERLALRIARTFDAPRVVAHPATLGRIGSAAEEGATHVEPQQA